MNCWKCRGDILKSLGISWMRALAAYLLVSLYAVCTCAARNVGCPPPAAGVPVSIEVPLEVKELALSDLKIAAWNGLDAAFLLGNPTSKNIDYLTIVLEFQMKEGHGSESVVFEAGPDTRQPSSYLIPAERVNPLPQPILAGESEWISGRSPYTPPGCPVSARPTMIDVHYSDGSALKWQGPEWRTDALLADYPLYLKVPDSKAWNSEEYFFSARVNSKGQMEDVMPFPANTQVPSDSVAQALKGLTFGPGLDKGNPAERNLVIFVRFIRPDREVTTSERDVREPPVSEPVVYISLNPCDSSETDWVFDFGRSLGYTTTVVRHEH